MGMQQSMGMRTGEHAECRNVGECRRVWVSAGEQLGTVKIKFSWARERVGISTGTR